LVGEFEDPAAGLGRCGLHRARVSQAWTRVMNRLDHDRLMDCPDFDSLLQAQQDLLDPLFRPVQVSEVVYTDGARDHLRHGLGRRLRILFQSVRAITALVPPERDEPIADHDEAAELDLHLNSAYVHIRGATDNAAWALAIEHQVLGPPRELDRDFQRAVGLLSREFRRNLAVAHPDLDARISAHCAHLEHLPQVRDPVAHRIPLYIVPSVLAPQEASRFRTLSEEISVAAGRKEWDTVDRKMGEQSMLGTFQPVFAHSMRAPVVTFPLYQRLGSDLNALIAVVSEILSFLEHKPPHSTAVTPP
jgi:hypothetical protein